jgi:hypothetical protein
MSSSNVRKAWLGTVAVAIASVGVVGPVPVGMMPAWRRRAHPRSAQLPHSV